MIGMDLLSLLILLVIGIVVAAILHYGFRFYVIPGTSSFLCKVVIGWLGAWLGSPVFGYWLEGLRYESVYYIPAVLGSLALGFACFACPHRYCSPPYSPFQR